jgi:sensor domain CHASE-containing protein
MREELLFERNVSGYAKMVFAIVGVCVGVVTWAYSTFATQQMVRETVLERLDRIETKLDRLIEFKK